MIRLQIFAALMAHDWRLFCGRVVANWRAARLCSAAMAHARTIEALGPIPADGPTWMSESEKAQWRRLQVAIGAAGDTGIAPEHLPVICATRVAAEGKVADIQSARRAEALAATPALRPRLAHPSPDFGLDAAHASTASRW